MQVHYRMPPHSALPAGEDYIHYAEEDIPIWNRQFLAVILRRSYWGAKTLIGIDRGEVSEAQHTAFEAQVRATFDRLKAEYETTTREVPAAGGAGAPIPH